ncbi:uncharacterized protein A4U43_C04F21370 [Asparagus officinalis]|uniref:Uncharacterized protein n=1 Tax=Asparagus officinalis TaxID=4686 RepID=A0A5P1F5D1_ASPOF|nr:uncharacterized protein A4U43_C04F21370 [Asparagus officinalis]
MLVARRCCLAGYFSPTSCVRCFHSGDVHAGCCRSSLRYVMSHAGAFVVVSRGGVFMACVAARPLSPPVMSTLVLCRLSSPLVPVRPVLCRRLVLCVPGVVASNAGRWYRFRRKAAEMRTPFDLKREWQWSPIDESRAKGREILGILSW